MNKSPYYQVFIHGPVEDFELHEENEPIKVQTATFFFGDGFQEPRYLSDDEVDLSKNFIKTLSIIAPELLMFYAKDKEVISFYPKAVADIAAAAGYKQNFIHDIESAEWTISRALNRLLGYIAVSWVLPMSNKDWKTRQVAARMNISNLTSQFGS